MGYWAWTYFDDDGTLVFQDRESNNKTCGSKQFNSHVDNYTIVDIETTGFSREYNDIIEIACLKVRSNKVVDNSEMIIRLEQLDSIPKKIEILTGITNEMVSQGNDIDYALKSFLNFLEDDVIVGHNITFDIGFLNCKIDRYLDCDFEVPYIDTLSLSREKFSNFTSHKLSFLSQALNLNNQSSHRALNDCYATFELYNLCRNESLDISKIIFSGENKSFDCTDEGMSGKYFCFTGTLVNMSRDEAINKCINLGAFSGSSVTIKTNYLVMGIQDYALFADGKESSKTKRAKQLIQAGQCLRIIDENEFIKMISLSLQEG